MRIPSGILGRLRLVGEALHGKAWRSKLADDIGVSRMGLHRWMQGSPTPADLDVRLLLALRAQNDATRNLHRALSKYLKSQKIEEVA